MHVDLYSDGSSKGNPGPGGYGTLLQYKDPKGVLHEREFSCGYKKTTNNRMELLGAIAGFEALNRPCSVDVYSDSQYMVKAFNEGWVRSWIRKGWKNSQNEPVKNKDLWERLLKAKESHEVKFHWVKGHVGHPQNERCDALAQGAAESGSLKDDPQFCPG